MGIINVFAFNGDIAFGRPDVWVGGTVSVPNTVRNNDQATFTYTVTNRGDAMANDVVPSVDSEYLTLKLVQLNK